MCCPELEEVYRLSHGLQPARIDVATQSLALTADIVIAYQLIERASNPRPPFEL